jgi:hypothetical protein
VILAPPEAPSLTVWPSIGGAVCDWIEDRLVHGPGPVRGSRVELTEEEQRFIWRMYEVHPAVPCGRSRCNCVVNVGRFRYEWSIYCRLKGSRKSELAAWLAHVELYGPCRFGGWDANGDPVPVSMWQIGGTADIPFAATAEEQARDTSWSSFMDIAANCAHADDLEVTNFKVSVRSGGAGNARVVTSSSIARDGGRPTFTVEEETHLWILPELVELDRVLDFNLAKLGSNDPHGVQVSTMFGVGEMSVLERYYDRYEEDPESGILLDIRSAPNGLDPKNDDDILTGIRAAKGDAEWLDEYKLFRRFKRNPAASRRFWWNQRTVSEKRVVDPDDWKALGVERPLIDGERITLGFDGSLYEDSTALVATCLSDGFQFAPLIAVPSGTEDGVMELRAAVDACLVDLFERFDVVRMYCDPPFWGDQISRWSGEYGAKRVLSWWTNRDTQMAFACQRWSDAIREGTLRHEIGNVEFDAAVRNAHKRSTRVVVDKSTGVFGFVVAKERLGSRLKVDAAVAAVLSWEARSDAIRGGILHERKRTGRVYAF